MDDDFRWSGLTRLAIHVHEAMSDRRESLDSTRSGAATHYDFALIVFQERTHRLLTAFESELSLRNSDLMLVACQLPVDLETNDVTSKLIKASCSGGGDVEVVIVLSETPKFATDLLGLVSQEVTFKWTSLKHTTEWLVVSPSETLMDSIRNETVIEVDFMTLVFTSGSDHLTVAQKSRSEDFQVDSVHKSCIDYFLAHTMKENLRMDSGIESGQCQRIDSVGQLRMAAIHYLRSKKSVLDGMVLPAAVLSEMEQRFYTYTADGNRTVYDGYSIALLDNLASFMGFTYTLVAENDSGFYGDVLDSGDATGITGQLARREAALTTLPLSITESRRTRIDYIATPTVVENVNIIYKLPMRTDHLDLTYLDIIQADFFLYLIGPVVVLGMIGATIHVLTKSCYSAGPEKFKKDNLRLLTKFPEHVCFHTDRTYKVQSGLILRTSWAIFWFILSSAYSAYLVTTFAVKPPELALKTFKQLLDHPEYTFGMTQHDSALQSFLRVSKDGVLGQLWSRLQQHNKTNPSTFCPDIEFHCRRVQAGGYAFVVMTSLDFLPEVDNPDVRTYAQKGLESINHAYIGTPKNTFYYQDLSRVVRSQEESGLLEKLKTAYFTPQTKKAASSKVSANGSVTFQRILLPVYCALGGVGLGLVSLLLELVLYRVVHKKHTNTEVTGNRSN